MLLSNVANHKNVYKNTYLHQLSTCIKTDLIFQMEDKFQPEPMVLYDDQSVVKMSEDPCGGSDYV